MWHNERRGKTWKAVERQDDPSKRMVTVSHAPMHYESVIDSGVFDTDINMEVVNAVRDRLNGVKMQAAGWHFGLQTEDAGMYQHEKGTFFYGGRQGEHWLGLKPHKFGYLDARDMSLDQISTAPAYLEPEIKNNKRTIGREDVTWELNRSADIEYKNLWTMPNGGSVDWKIAIRPGRVKSDFVITEQARSWIETGKPHIRS